MVALIGKLISSEQAPNRDELQAELQSALNRINKEGRNILSPYTITLEDEFQGVYKSLEDIFEHIWLILYSLHPVKLHFSIGVGEIATQINRKQAIGMDGTAFHRAHRGIEQLRKNKSFFTIQVGEKEYSALINNALILISGLMDKWEKKRFAILYGLSRERSISEMADFLDITERSIYKNIRAGSLETIRDTVREIGRIINQSREE